MTTEEASVPRARPASLYSSIMASVAAFERSVMLERTRAGLAGAKARGKLPGRRRIMLPADVVLARKLLDAGERIIFDTPT